MKFRTILLALLWIAGAAVIPSSAQEAVPSLRGKPTKGSFAAAPDGAHVFRRNGRNGQPVYLFDMKHGLCVLSHEAAAVEPTK